MHAPGGVGDVAAPSAGARPLAAHAGFYVVEGKLLLDVEGRGTTELLPRQGMMVPKGVVHRTRAPSRTVVLMVEAASVVPTGD